MDFHNIFRSMFGIRGHPHGDPFFDDEVEISGNEHDENCDCDCDSKDDPFGFGSGFNFSMNFGHMEEMIRQFDEAFRDLESSTFGFQFQGQGEENYLNLESGHLRDRMLKEHNEKSPHIIENEPDDSSAIERYSQPFNRSMFGIRIPEMPTRYRNPPNIKMKVDNDLDDLIKDNNDVNRIIEESTNSKPEQNFKKFSGNFSVSIKTVRHPDGSTETIKTTRDADGERTEVTKTGPTRDALLDSSPENILKMKDDDTSDASIFERLFGKKD